MSDGSRFTYEVGASCWAADLQRAAPQAGLVRLQLPPTSKLALCHYCCALLVAPLVGTRPQA